MLRGRARGVLLPKALRSEVGAADRSDSPDSRRTLNFCCQEHKSTYWMVSRPQEGVRKTTKLEGVRRLQLICVTKAMRGVPGGVRNLHKSWITTAQFDVADKAGIA